MASCDYRAVGPVEGSDSAVGRVAQPSRSGGVVFRSNLLERLETSARVTVVSAPPGSGKTVLLRSWIDVAGLADSVAWVSVGRDDRDPPPFWVSVLAALRGTAAGSGLVRKLTAAPDLDGWAIAERLLKDLALLDDRLWLVIDDLHELGSADTLRQLELLVMRAPPQLRFVLATRHDVRLGLHRLRLEGELTEIRAADLRFTPAEARELLAVAGAKLSEPALVMLYERTEGWAAGLRLAALSLAGHSDPERFAAEFSGSERMVAEYLLAEVLERQGEEVRRLLLRTSVLERVSGPLADALTGGTGGERILQELEEANAFVASLDTARTWFRYHHLFAGLLQLELRRAAPAEVTGLHAAAAEWFAVHGFPAEAVRHAQAAENWALAARLLADHWPSLYLDGQTAIAHDLTAGFPVEVRGTDAELAALAAADELAQGSLETAERYVELAEHGLASASAGARGQVQVLLGVVRLLLARQRGDLPAVIDAARRLRDVAEALDTPRAGLGEELRALALVSLGSTEYWAALRADDAEAHLERGVALARRVRRPFLEFTGLAHQAAIENFRSPRQGAKRSRQAIELAERHGWTDEPAAGVAYAILATALVTQGRPDEAEPWLQRAERTVRTETEPAEEAVIHHIRGLLELVRGQDQVALEALRTGEQLAPHIAASHYFLTLTRALLLHALVRSGETERAERLLADLEEQDRERGVMRIATAALRLAQGNPQAATDALAAVMDGSAPAVGVNWPVQALLLEAVARDALGDEVSMARALERALDMAEPDGVRAPFLLYPAPALLERHARRRTAHAALIAEILDLLAGRMREPPPAAPRAPLEPLSDSEIRVLRYLPTNLSIPEIASQLYVSPNTVKTHVRNLYTKLGTHRRTEAVERARALGLLAPAPRAR